MNALLVYIVNPQDLEQVTKFLIANSGDELSPGSGWWRIETELSFKHAFLRLWFWVGDQGFLRIVDLGASKQSFAFPTHKRGDLFKSESILERLLEPGKR